MVLGSPASWAHDCRPACPPGASLAAAASHRASAKCRCGRTIAGPAGAATAVAFCNKGTAQPHSRGSRAFPHPNRMWVPPSRPPPLPSVSVCSTTSYSAHRLLLLVLLRTPPLLLPHSCWGIQNRSRKVLAFFPLRKPCTTQPKLSTLVNPQSNLPV
jgi:hypothetical protein